MPAARLLQRSTLHESARRNDAVVAVGRVRRACADAGGAGRIESAWEAVARHVQLHGGFRLVHGLPHGLRMPVAQEGDNAALEAAYSKARQMAGAPLLAVVEGRVEDRLPMEGNLERPTLIVESSSPSNRRVVRDRNPPRNSKTPTGSS